MPYIAGCEIHDNPLQSRSAARCRELLAERGDDTPIAWLPRDERYVEKLATPDVTIADIIGDIDPIKAARGGHDLSSELTMHYGLLPRANRGIFAINELPDLAGKIQVGLFNIMQEGDVQIKGYPVRLPLDVLLVFTRQSGGLHGARQDHYAAEGPHRVGDSHALSGHGRRRHGHHRAGSLGRSAARRASCVVPDYLREVVEQIAFLAREDKRDRQALRRQPAPADRVPGKRGQQRRAARGAQSRRTHVRAAHRRCLRRRCRPSPASWNWNTKAS